MRVLVACEFSGKVRDAFTKRGHYALSCDLLPTETPGLHYQGDVRDILNDGWDLMVAHPPCTYISRAGARWWHIPERQRKAEEAIDFVFELLNANIRRIAIENPIGKLSQVYRKPDQIIQPYQFGHPFSKATCLWLDELPLLRPTNILHRHTKYLPANTGFGAKLGQQSSKGVARAKRDRERTFQGIADAMAEQWG